MQLNINTDAEVIGVSLIIRSNDHHIILAVAPSGVNSSRDDIGSDQHRRSSMNRRAFHVSIRTTHLKRGDVGTGNLGGYQQQNRYQPGGSLLSV